MADHTRTHSPTGTGTESSRECRMIKDIAIGFRERQIADGFIIQNPGTRHEHDDELISIFRRRKDAVRNRILCNGSMLEATHTDFDKMLFVVAMYAHDRSDLPDRSVMFYVHPKHYTTIIDQIWELKP
jgi:hypothetical protein